LGKDSKVKEGVDRKLALLRILKKVLHIKSFSARRIHKGEGSALKGENIT